MMRRCQGSGVGQDMMSTLGVAEEMPDPTWNVVSVGVSVGFLG